MNNLERPSQEPNPEKPISIEILRDAVRSLENYLKANPNPELRRNLDNLLLVHARISRLNREKEQEVITQENFRVELNRLRLSVRSYAESFEFPLEI